MFELKKIEFNKNALEPFMSSQTIDFHYGKHHQAYVDKLNNEIKDSQEFSNLSLEEIIKKTANNKNTRSIFNNAAQVFNHDFFWKSLSPQKQEISDEFLAKIEEKFLSFENFKDIFIQTAVSQFGSGWAWLVKNQDNDLDIIKTANADNPLTKNLIPLFTIDLWEHAYYLDYQNRRSDFVEAILDNLVNWEFILKSFKK